MRYRKASMMLLILLCASACAINTVPIKPVIKDYCFLYKPVRYSRHATPPAVQDQIDANNATYEDLHCDSP